MSSFSWLDFAEADRQRTLDVIDLFRERDTRDELGLATVRDALADRLFPATGTVQTRARYLLIVPWTYRRLEQQRVESHAVADKARRCEVHLIDVLDRSADRKGVIGVLARGSLKRLPSAIYWNGLGRLGIRTFPGSRDQYHRSLDRHHRRGGLTLRNDDGEPAAEGQRRNWDAGLPAPPAGFPHECSLALEPHEGTYLADRLRLTAPRSLLTHLVARADGPADVAFPWEHPGLDTFPTHLREELGHARNFSEVMHGAALLYNYMLASLRGESEWAADYADSVMEWVELCGERAGAVADWDTDAFWTLVRSDGARVAPATRAFVMAWVRLVRTGLRRRWLDDAEARVLIHDRERQLKRKQARLAGGRALEMWGGAAGTGRLDYRWRTIARQFVLDVRHATEAADALAA